jgi:hypothetical protein
MTIARWTGWCVLVLAGCAKASGSPAGLSPERVADYVHAVIAADRATYAEHVVHRLQNEAKVIKATEYYEEEKGLPLPSQMLRLASQRVAEGGSLRYALLSEWAINKANQPRTDAEKKGLAAVRENPKKPYGETVSAGDKKYFVAVYPDVAVSEACVLCHNDHKESPRSDFKVGEVMGGVVITLLLDG